MGIDADIDGAVERLRESGVQLRRVKDAPWVEDVERRLNLRFPPSYRSLVTRYAFSSFIVSEVELFANIGDGAEWDVTVAPFRDAYMSPWLAAHHLLHIGQPDGGSYDPICLDLSAAGSEPSAIQLDHEDILLERKRVTRYAVAPSFLNLLTGPIGA